MDCAQIQDIGNIPTVVDAGSSWIELFRKPHSGKSLAGVFDGVGVTHTLVCDNAKEVSNDKVVTWLQAQRFTKMKSPIHNPRSLDLPNGLCRL